jgi:hypothetical protein
MWPGVSSAAGTEVGGSADTNVDKTVPVGANARPARVPMRLLERWAVPNTPQQNSQVER